MKKTILISALFVCAIAQPLFSTTWTVPSGQFTTLQDVLDYFLVKDGDSIQVGTGIHEWGNITFNGKAVRVYSAGGPATTIIDCGNIERGFLFNNNEDANSILEGFTIQNASVAGNGGAVFCQSASPTIEDCIIKDSTATNGGGIYCQDSSPDINNCSITNNDAANGAGIYCTSSSDPNITDSTIANNDAAIEGGGIYCLNSDPNISNVNINNNTASFGAGVYCQSASPIIHNDTKIISNTVSNTDQAQGGGIYFSNGSPQIIDCNISNNNAQSEFMTADGAGIYCENGSILVIKNTIISQNTASTDVFSPDYSYGGGLFTDWSEVTISNSIITDNNSDTGAGIYFFDANTFRVESSIIAQNVASEAGGGVNMENNSNGIINNCTISANSGGFGGGIECYKSSPTISSCVISGNQATYARGGGIDCYGSSPLISNCTISSNSAYNDVGGGINCEADTIPINPVGSKPSIENCIFENNSEFAIFEYDGYNNPGGDSDPTVKYNLFYNNEPDAVATYGDYWDYDVSYSYSGDPCVPPGYHIDDIGDGHAHDNTGGDPLFKMNGPEEITGSWTSVSYNVIKNKTTLTDSLASFTRRSLIGSLINPDTNQRRQAFIKGNNITKVKVVGDITSTAADGYGFVQSGDSYRLIDYHIPENSPCIEAADPGYVVSPNDMDIDYQPRIVGPRLDIGADEYAIIGDLNFNGWIEEFDIGLFVSRWLETGCSDYAGDNTNWCSGTDINRDTVVDFFDFGKIVENQ